MLYDNPNPHICLTLFVDRLKQIQKYATEIDEADQIGVKRKFIDAFSKYEII